MARPRRGPDRRITAALLVLLCASCLFALGDVSTDSGHHGRSHPVAHAVKDAGKLLPGAGARTGGNDGGLPAGAPFAAAAVAVLVLTALRYGRRDAGGQQCHAAATSSRGPPGRPVLA